MPDSRLAGLRDVLLPPRCAGCAAAGSWYCIECRDGSDPIVRRLGALVLTATGAHEGPLREAIHRLKYGDEPGLAAELGALVGQRVAADLARGIGLDALVPVRLHPRRERERGYDQALALTTVAAAAAGLPVRPVIHRLRSGPAQATLGQVERRANVHGAFVGVAGSLRGLRVGLVDDVATTGATLLDAAAAARACGARDVRAYVVAFEE
ncbi:MAG: ComF family protein [Chloroflexota bacterium]|nr:ComF family protein [Chloroflexota bacterium]